MNTELEKTIQLPLPNKENQFVYLHFTRPTTDANWVMQASNEFITDLETMLNGH